MGLGIKCNLTGLHTLKIKETDRLLALKKELSKFNLKVKITDDSISFDNVDFLKPNVVIETMMITEWQCHSLVWRLKSKL
ncbi:MAG: hypothetical protein CM15mP36_08560 [Flavobacteriales bacterium]|nr:MAG: hypothetical protein CM15mP36_08560 [Flavobacteriales bacterium]